MKDKIDASHLYYVNIKFEGEKHRYSLKNKAEVDFLLKAADKKGIKKSDIKVYQFN